MSLRTYTPRRRRRPGPDDARQADTGCPNLGASIKKARNATDTRRYSSPYRHYIDPMPIAELAKLIEVSRSALSRYESGARAIRRPLLDRIESALNVRFQGVEERRSRHHGERFCRQKEGAGFTRAAGAPSPSR